MKIQSFLQAKQREYLKKKKLLKRKLFFVKVKLFLIFILPVVIILLTVKVLKTFLQIKLRNAASKTVTKDQEKNKGSAPAKRPVSQTFFKPQFITPVPVREKK